MSAPTDADSLALYKAPDEQAAKINEYISNHPLSVSLRANPLWSESRPHLRFVDEHRQHSLTGGTLLGPGKIPVPPLVFVEEGKHVVSMSYLGTDLCGHVGIIHGGLLATLCDEGLARCGFSALPNKIGVTASLTVNYKNPAPAGSYVVLKAETIKTEGRKVWVKGRIELLTETEEPGKILVEAEALFIEPRYAKVRLSSIPAPWSGADVNPVFTKDIQRYVQINVVLKDLSIAASDQKSTVSAFGYRSRSRRSAIGNQYSPAIDNLLDPSYKGCGLI